MADIQQSFKAPLRDPISIKTGHITRSWEWFFRLIQDALYPLGVEKQFTLVNNQSSAANIDGMIFNKAGVTSIIVEYLVQRITTGAGAVELLESGSFNCTYRPTSDDWVLTVLDENSPVNANIVFSITALGQVKYTTSNESGTASISNIFYRARTLSGKNVQYSRVNR